MDGDGRLNPFLTGNFAPVRSEDDFTLMVRGNMPRELRGVLYRNGPNPQFEPRDGNHHWFVGDGMIHAFAIEDGGVTYRNRWVRTHKWSVEHAAGHALFGSWGNPMTSDPAVVGTDSGVANTNIVWHGGHLLALEEAHAPFELQARTLAPRGPYNLGGKVTAHPKIDPLTGEMIFFAYADDDMPLSNKVSWGIADAQGRLLRRETFEAPYCSMIHDFMVTEHHVLIPILPLSGSLDRAMRGGPVFAWEPEQPARVAVMRRDTGVASLRWFDVDACYVFHARRWPARQRIGGHADAVEFRSDKPIEHDSRNQAGRSAGRVPPRGSALRVPRVPARLVRRPVVGPSWHEHRYDCALRPANRAALNLRGRGRRFSV
jgi:carotenoid cleavage dioxygenase